MIIRYNNGQTLEAVLLSGTETTMRLAMENHDDVLVLTLINDVWVSDGCEPVQLDVPATRHGYPAEVTEEDCICSHELAAKLIQLLYTGQNDIPRNIPVAHEHVAAALSQVI